MAAFAVKFASPCPLWGENLGARWGTRTAWIGCSATPRGWRKNAACATHEGWRYSSSTGRYPEKRGQRGTSRGMPTSSPTPVSSGSPCSRGSGRCDVPIRMEEPFVQPAGRGRTHCSQSSGTLSDALGRRIRKTVTNAGDCNGTEGCLNVGRRIVQIDNGAMPWQRATLDAARCGGRLVGSSVDCWEPDNRDENGRTRGNGYGLSGFCRILLDAVGYGFAGRFLCADPDGWPGSLEVV